MCERSVQCQQEIADSFVVEWYFQLNFQSFADTETSVAVDL
jgi:hypothetical protein